MDLTTLATALFIAFGLLGVDTIAHSDTVELVVTAAPSLTKSERMSLDQATVEQEFEFWLRRIAGTPSLIPTPLIHTSQDEGIGLAVFTTINLKHVASALQSELGYASDQVRLTLYIEDGELRGLISGVDRRVGTFRTVLTAGKDETLLDFVHRCAEWTALQLAPYTATLYELQQHVGDQDFASVIAMAEHAKGAMPPAPVSFDRSLFDNLIGLVALFRNDPRAARASFEAAMEAYPANAPPVLNAAFADIELGDYQRAAERMRRLVTDVPLSDKILRASAYTTWAAAEMGRHDFAAAEALLAKSTSLNPGSSSAFDLWAEAKQAAGDAAAAAALHRQALANSVRFENFGELATLYFRLGWQPGQPVTRNKYINPTLVTFH